MMRKLGIILCIMALIIFILPANAIAENSVADKQLPKLTLPELKELKIPELSRDYEDMLKELEKEGFGQKKFESNNPLPLPEVEAPEGTGKNAFEKFQEEYGDMWNSEEHQLNNPDIIPNDEEFESFFNSFKNENIELFRQMRNANKEKVKELLKKQLDISSRWNFDELKSDVKFMTEREKDEFLGKKPEGWKGGINITVPKMEEWFENTPKARGYEESVLKGLFKEIEGYIPGDLGLSDNVGTIIDFLAFKQSDETKRLEKEYRQNPTEENLKKYAESIRKDNAKRKSVITDQNNARTDKLLMKDQVKIYEIEQKYGKGNAQYVGDFGLFNDTPIYVNKNSLIGKIANALWRTQYINRTKYYPASEETIYYTWERNEDGILVPVANKIGKDGHLIRQTSEE